MTLHPSAAHKKPRWLALIVVVATLLLLAASFASAHNGSTVPIPARYSGGTQVDSDPAPAPAVNDQPGQVDMTQMGRDTSVNPKVRIFWSWDAISLWTGTGQTGDACALFDTDDTDAKINYVVCARVNNPNADPTVTSILPASTDHPVYLFDCNNKWDDRCGNPAPRSYTAGQVLAGPLAATLSLTSSGTGNLQNHNDPFDSSFAAGPGEAYPHDTSIEIEVASALVPTGVRLANVCSYPSAGNGGNNNPFDCIVTPGVQYGNLVVNKTLVNDNGGTATVGSFRFTAGSGTATTGVVTSTAFTATSTTTGSNTVNLPVGTYSVAEVGTPITGYTTTYSSGCASVSVTAGGTATCTITNNDQQGTLIVNKTVVNDNGGTATVGSFNFTAGSGTATTGVVASTAFTPSPSTSTTNGSNSIQLNAGTYSVAEVGTPITGYTTTYSNCTSVVITNGGTATCTVTNNDNIAAPSISTVMGWTLMDRMVLTGFVSGGATTATGTNTATFTLYKDTLTLSSCEASTQVSGYTPEVVTVTATGTAATLLGYTTEDAGTYHWIVTYSGNTFNAPISSPCTGTGSEITTLP